MVSDPPKRRAPLTNPSGGSFSPDVSPSNVTQSENLESFQGGIREAYEKSDLYDSAHICLRPETEPLGWADRLLADRLALVRQHYDGGTLLDLCCATGEHLLALAPGIERGIGVDFTNRYVAQATKAARERDIGHVAFVQGDAKCVPIPTGSAGLVYCFSSLYAIPGVADVIAEVTRVLRPGGTAVLDFGNRRSLNTYCLTFYTDWPSTFPVTVGDMRRMLTVNHLRLVECRSYQLLPLWAGLPRRLWPLLHPVWREILRRRVAGRMLDEHLSSLPGLRNFAFRHLIVCRKVTAIS